MSLKGIDTQVMLHRVNDVAKEVSVAQKRPEHMNAAAARTMQNEAEHQQEQIVDISQVENLVVSRDNKKKQNNEKNETPKRTKSGEQKKASSDEPVTPGEPRSIDILI